MFFFLWYPLSCSSLSFLLFSFCILISFPLCGLYFSISPSLFLFWPRLHYFLYFLSYSIITKRQKEMIRPCFSQHHVSNSMINYVPPNTLLFSVVCCNSLDRQRYGYCWKIWLCNLYVTYKKMEVVWQRNSGTCSAFLDHAT